MKPLILGSQSPRRKEILGFFKYPFIQVSPSFDEEAAPVLEDPAAYALSLSKGKADSLLSHYPHDMILTADTVVWKEGRFYGKPVNREEAYRFLSEFSGGWQTVVTGMTLVKEGEFFQEHGLTKVLFNTLSHEQKNYILDAGAWEDKAGGYGAQGSTSLLVKSYEGCFYNVLGLPVNVYSSLLSRIGINLWQYV